MTHKDAFDRGYNHANEEWKARVQELYNRWQKESLFQSEIFEELLNSGKEKGQ